MSGLKFDAFGLECSCSQLCILSWLELPIVGTALRCLHGFKAVASGKCTDADLQSPAARTAGSFNIPWLEARLRPHPLH